MSKKGFTLVEALLVIAIIGVLLLTLIPSVITIINKNKEKSCLSTKDSILSTAKMFVAENKYNLNIDCNSNVSGYPIVKIDESEISLEILRQFGNLSDKNIDSRFPELEVTYNCSTKEFSYNYENENIVDCKS